MSGSPADPSKALGAYREERINLPSDFDANEHFDNDRHELADRPGFHIFGKCPSCWHETYAVCAADQLSPHASSADQAKLRWDYRTRLRDFRPLIPARPPGRHGDTGDRTVITVLRCACVDNHAPQEKGPSTKTPASHAGSASDTDARASGVFGCGSEWLLAVTYDPNPKNREKAKVAVVSAEDASRCWPAADAAYAEVGQALTDAQTSAKGWGTAFTAMLTLLGVGGLVATRSSVQTLPTVWQVLFGITAFVALVADAVMLIESNFASFGSPGISQALPSSAPAYADLDPLMEAKSSTQRLRVSVGATAVAAVAASAAVGILLFA